MKIKEGFLLRSVAGRTVVITDGDTLNLNLMIGLNDTGKFLWELLKKDSTAEELKAALMEEYDVTDSIAEKDVQTFVENLKKNSFLEES